MTRDLHPSPRESSDPAPRPTVGGETPVEIAERTWWVGHHLAGDPFQCHVYLIEHGEDSVLIDPGGHLTFPSTWEKVCQIIDPGQLRWIVCQHQDPDIAASLPVLDGLVRRPDARIVTHWRAAALLTHYGCDLPFHLIDEHEWVLDLHDGEATRRLEFVFTPYLHFPGAFTTFDRATGTLFSSDLFGGFTTGPELYAASEDYFEDLRPFHEHYMPSQEILQHGLDELAKLPVRLIAPQHGRLIPEGLIAPIAERLRVLECGLYLMVRHDTDVARLSRMNALLRRTLNQLALSRSLAEVADALAEPAAEAFGATGLEFYALDEQGRTLLFSSANAYRGSPSSVPEDWAPLLQSTRPEGDEPPPRLARGGTDPALAMALCSPLSGAVTGLAVMHVRRGHELSEAAVVALGHVAGPLEAALERELLFRAVDRERERFYRLALRDPLTGLYNRFALADAVERLLAMHDRGSIGAMRITMFDIDRFKAVNDTYGHACGDVVLTSVGQVIEMSVRSTDIAARIGGEEFVVVEVGGEPAPDPAAAERVREKVGTLRFDEPSLRVTLSAGVVDRRPGEPFADALARADAALYEAKHQGRDRSVRR